MTGSRRLGVGLRPTGGPWAFILALALWAGCGSDDDGGGAPDGAIDPDGGVVVMPPAPPAPVALTPCPTGWSESDRLGFPTCEPFPGGAVEDCPTGEAHFPGEAGCAPVGSACPAGDFSDVLPTDRPVMHVLPGASGGDGSATRPYGALTEFSLGGLAAGTVIALGRGRHVAEARLTRGLSLWGSCPPETELVSSVPNELEGVVTVLGAGSEVRDLRVGPSPRPGIWMVGTGRSLFVGGVEIGEATGAGMVIADQSELTVESLVVRDTVPRASDLTFGRGLDLAFDARATIRRAAFERNAEFGVTSGPDGAHLLLEDAVVRDTRPRGLDGRGGRGVEVEAGSVAELARVIVQGNRDVGVFAAGMASRVRLEQAVVRDTASDENQAFGRGLQLQEGASAQVLRTVFTRNRSVGIFAVGAPGTAVLTDVAVVDTLSTEASGRMGRGINGELGAVLDIERAIFRGNRNVSVFAASSAELDAQDLVVRDTEADEDGGLFGRAVTLQAGARGGIVRALFEGNRDVAVTVGLAGTTLSLEDVLIRDTRPRVSDDGAGRGLVVQEGSTTSARRMRLEGNRDIAVLVGLEGASLDMEMVTIADTAEQACATAGCADRPFGTALMAHRGASIILRDFAIRGAALCGVHVTEGGQADLMDGEIRGCAIGACNQSAGFDIERLSQGVAFVDNGVNLDSTSLPVPEPSVPADVIR